MVHKCVIISIVGLVIAIGIAVVVITRTEVDHVVNESELYTSTPPPPPEWGPWAAWSTCSSSCGFGGSRLRRRECQDHGFGLRCFGAAAEFGDCGFPLTCGSCNPDDWVIGDGVGPAAEKFLGNGFTKETCIRACLSDESFNGVNMDKTFTECTCVRNQTRVIQTLLNDIRNKDLASCRQ